MSLAPGQSLGGDPSETQGRGQQFREVKGTLSQSHPSHCVWWAQQDWRGMLTVRRRDGWDCTPRSSGAGLRTVVTGRAGLLREPCMKYSLPQPRAFCGSWHASIHAVCRWCEWDGDFHLRGLHTLNKSPFSHLCYSLAC